MLIEQSIAKQYGILPAAQGELGWAEWVKLVGGLMDDTPLGRVVAVRSESDAKMCIRDSPHREALRLNHHLTGGGFFMPIFRERRGHYAENVPI